MRFYTLFAAGLVESPHGYPRKQSQGFHEKAATYEACFALSMSSSLFFAFSRAASVATLPPALCSVQVGCSRFSRRRLLISVLCCSLWERSLGPGTCQEPKSSFKRENSDPSAIRDNSGYVGNSIESFPNWGLAANRCGHGPESV